MQWFCLQSAKFTINIGWFCSNTIFAWRNPTIGLSSFYKEILSKDSFDQLPKSQMGDDICCSHLDFNLDKRNKAQRKFPPFVTKWNLLLRSESWGALLRAGRRPTNCWLFVSIRFEIHPILASRPSSTTLSVSLYFFLSLSFSLTLCTVVVCSRVLSHRLEWKEIQGEKTSSKIALEDEETNGGRSDNVAWKSNFQKAFLRKSSYAFVVPSKRMERNLSIYPSIFNYVTERQVECSMRKTTEEIGMNAFYCFPTRTTILPMLSPVNKPMKASGVFSKPFKVVSLILILPSLIHSAIWMIPSFQRFIHRGTRNPSIFNSYKFMYLRLELFSFFASIKYQLLP